MAATLRSAGGVTVRTSPATPCRLPAAAAAGASCRRPRPAHAGPAADTARRRGRGRHPHVPRASTSPSGAASAAWARARSPSRGPGSDPPLWDCVGMGEALVDCCAAVEDGLLVEFGVAKGGRRVIDAADRAALLARLDRSLDIAAGGSAANTLSALARLGDADAAARGGGRLRVALAPVAGTDAQAAFHAAELGRAGVEVLPGCQSAEEHGATGTVFVLTTPDANRSFLSHVAFAPGGLLSPSPHALAAASRSRLLLVEGYLWAAPGAEAAIAAAVAAARAGGALVAFTAGDAGVVTRHRAALWRALQAGWADVLFANAAEAAALLAHEDGDGSAPAVTALEAARALGPHVGLAAVTDGASGAVLSALGELHVVPPVWVPSRPVDTNGAGDAFAAGALWGLLRGLPVPAVGRAGARAASATIQHTGAALGAAEAGAVVAAMEGEAARLVGGPGLAGGSPLTPADLIAASVEAGALEC